MHKSGCAGVYVILCLCVCVCVCACVRGSLFVSLYVLTLVLIPHTESMGLVATNKWIEQCPK